MTIYLKQSTASQEVPLGYFLDSTDGNTEETGLTIANTDIKLHKAGATTLANKNSGGATHISNGIYYAVLDATDTNTLGSMVIYCHPTGALATKVDCVVLAANVYDSMIGGGDTLDVQVTGMGANVMTASALATDAVTEIQSGLATPTNITAGTITTVTNLTNLPAAAATAAEMAKVPKSDSTVTWNATALASINAQADLAISDAALATAAALATVDTVVDSILVDTAEIGVAGAGLTALATQASVNAIDSNVDAILVDTGTTIPAQISGLNDPTAAAIADAVWDEATAGHTTAGTTGKALTDAGSAGDPWSTTLPGAYGAGTAGKILGDNLNATVSSRATQTSVDDLPTNAELATALGGLNDFDPATDIVAHVTLVDTTTTNTDMRGTDNAAVSGDIPTAVENADALLGRNVAGGSSSGRLVKEALYVLRNKTEIEDGTLTVYGTDDTTSAFTAAVNTAAGDPITSIDPS